ncbi:ethionine resistance protein [Mucor velutinosus]|uniref:Ethionine resistance protein n=1 Tax=Mucor velutinosus TaxID=708070 RepID=A0AAN7D4D6_9FUNG|nr:ethionine resistance protein [Mucor velutinosus]
MKSSTLAFVSALALSACLSIANSQPIHNTDLVNVNTSTQVVKPVANQKRYVKHHSSGRKKRSTTTKYTTKYTTKRTTKYTTKHTSKSHLTKRTSKHSSRHSKRRSSKHSSKKHSSSKHSSSKHSTKTSSKKRSSTKKPAKKSSSKNSVKTKSISSCYKKATFTQYWIPKEGDKDMLNDGKIVTLTGPKNKALKSDSGSTIAKVSKTTYDKFQMEGTGLLKNGVMVNLGDSDKTFQKVDRSEAPYGLGSDDNIHLSPWVSVASNDLKIGTKLYVKELDGVKLPDGKTHNGCVRVDDEGWSFHGCQLDFFVLQFTAYEKLENILPEKVTVSAQDCKILDYVTDSVKNWAVINK